jgi:hypothetical protein
VANILDVGDEPSMTTRYPCSRDYSGAIVGWTGLIRVDNTAYTWMGNPNPLPQKVTQKSFTYTSTRSIFEFDVAGKISMKVTFLSPVTPNDLTLQSAPVSYISVDIHSLDGNEHDVQLYSDVSGGMLYL